MATTDQLICDNLPPFLGHRFTGGADGQVATCIDFTFDGGAADGSQPGAPARARVCPPNGDPCDTAAGPLCNPINGSCIANESPVPAGTPITEGELILGSIPFEISPGIVVYTTPEVRGRTCALANPRVPAFADACNAMACDGAGACLSCIDGNPCTHDCIMLGTSTCTHGVLAGPGVGASGVADPTTGASCGVPPDPATDPSLGCAVAQCNALAMCVSATPPLHGATGQCSDNSHGSDRPGACFHLGCASSACVEIPNASECTPWLAQNTQGCPANLLTCDVNAGAALPGAPNGCRIDPTAGLCLIGGFCVSAGPSAANRCVTCDPTQSTTGFVIDPTQEGVERTGPTGCRVCHGGLEAPCDAPF